MFEAIEAKVISERDTITIRMINNKDTGQNVDSRFNINKFKSESHTTGSDFNFRVNEMFNPNKSTDFRIVYDKLDRG